MNMQASIGLADTIALLRSEGYSNASAPKIYYGMSAGKIERPEMDGSRTYRFAKKDLKSIRAFLSVVPTRGRRSAIHA